MRDYIEKACDEIDAAMFTGDSFVEPKAREEMQHYLNRWNRGLAAYADTFPNGVEPEEEGG